MGQLQRAVEHLQEHQTYPATKEDLVAACNNLSDFRAEDKKWFSDNLPEGKYKSPGDVMMALSM